MGNGHSKLNCTSKKSKRQKDLEKKKNGQTLSDSVRSHRDAVDGLQNKATRLVSRVSTRDRALVEGRLGDSEKKFHDIADQVEKTQRQYDIIDANLDDIKKEVDQYLEWLKDKEKRIAKDAPRVYSVKEAEAKLGQNNELRQELEDRRTNLENVRQKSDSLVQDLSRVERNMVERWIARLQTEHQKVMDALDSQNKSLAEQAGERAVFQESIDKVNLWLQDKEQEVQKLNTVRLTSGDVEKQIEKCKSLHSEVVAYQPHIENLRKLVEPLLVDCSPNLAAELKHMISEVESRNESLLTSLKQEEGHLKDLVTARKLFETDVHKVDRWCKETEISLSTEPNLECAIEVLDEQCKHYRNLQKTSQLFESLVKEIEERGSGFLPEIYDADKVRLEGILKSTKEKFNRVTALIKDRVESTEASLQSRSQVHESLTEATDWLRSIQDEIKHLQNTPIGPNTEDANAVLEKYEDVSEKLANYQPSIAQLNQAVERLRSNGQNMEADEILQLTSQYEMALDKVDQEIKTCKQAVAFRQNYSTQKAQLEAAIKECEDQINEVAQSGMPVAERIEKFKAISEKLQSMEPLYMVVSDKAHQLSLLSGDDGRSVTENVQQLKSHMDQLKKQADKKTKQCDRIQKSRVEFDSSIDDAIVWLEQKEDILASCNPQDMEPDKVVTSLQKHNALAREALDRIAAVKDKAKLETAHYEKLGEPIPPTMEDKLNQVKSLEDSIKEAITKKENYLEEAKTDRMQFEMSMKQINDWISGAEEMLDSGYEGLDYDTLTDTLSEHKDYFSEASMCQDEMEQVMELSERLLPTLDNNDKETLRQTLKNTNKKLSDVMAASQRRQQNLEKHAEEWQDYKDMVFNVTEQLQVLEEQYATCEHLPAANPALVQQQLVTSKDFLTKIEDVRGAMNDLNDKSHDLEKDGNSSSRSFINHLMDDLNDRYNSLTTTTENKQMTLQNLKGHWDEYTTLLEEVENLVNNAEQSLPTIEIESAPNHELLTQLNETKQICTQIQVSEPKIEALKRCTENLQRSLPTAEAKIQTQEKLMNVLEKLERVQDNVNEYHVALLEEIDDRGSFQTEADQTVQWLTEAKMELERLDPGKEVADVVERIEKQKVLQQEVAIRMDQMEQVAQQKKAKYMAMGKDLPEELLKQIVDMKELESDVANVIRVKGEELQHIKADREEVTSSLKDVSLWLTDAELRLQDRIINIPDSIHNLQVLQSEFDDIKPTLDKLRKRGSDLIQHTPDSIEKQLVQKALADTNRQWLAVQGKAADRSRKLEEAKDLLQNFNEVADSLEKWLQGADSVVQKDAPWTNFDIVKEQLKQHRKLTKDLDLQQDKLTSLGAISKRLEQNCDATGPRDRLSKLNRKMFNLHSKASEKLNALEEVNDDIDDYEDELGRLRIWMDETRSHLTMRDTSLTLKEQLAVYERVLEDIDGHKGKALLVEQKQSELKTISGQDEPDASLATEVSQLQKMAREQCEMLQESIIQQEEYESDIRHLSSAITEAQDKLLSSPVQAADVTTLKKQIAEHNALACQIKSYQDKINDINQKSKYLSERSLGMRPAMVEKLSQMGFRYPSSLPSLKVDPNESYRTGPDSGIFTSPGSSLNATQRSVSDADFSSSTMRSGKHGRSSDKLEQRPSGSLSGRSDDTDITIENYPGLFETMDIRPQKKAKDQSEQRSRSPSPFVEDKMAQQLHESVQMSSVTPQQRPGSMGIHRNVASLQPFSEMEVSASVPNLLQPQLMGPPRERSASFGAKLKPKIGELALLNTSWNTLQQQLGAREHELQVALQKQERYQQAVQDVTLKMERTQSKLARTYPSSLADLDKQLKDYKESLSDIESIREDIARVRERGRQIVEMSDPEGYNTMQATLTMLTDRVDNLQALADAKGKQLQNAVKDKEKHEISLTAYKKHLKDLEEWVEEMKIRQASTPLPTDSVQSLRQYLHDNQTLQEELNNRLQLVSDLAVQCDALCERETPSNAEKFRSQLTNLQGQLGNLKLSAIEKQGPTRAAIKESEKRQKEMDDYEQKVRKLQDWVSDTKQMTIVPPNIETLVFPEDHQSLQQQLKSDLTEHRQLVQQLSVDAPVYQSREPVLSSGQQISEAELNQRWQDINDELNNKKEQLEDLLRGRRSMDVRGSYSWMSPTDAQGQLKDIRHNLDELNNLWQQLNNQVEDKQLRLDQALDYQQRYQEALQNISQWLDLAEQRIMSPVSDKDSQQQLRENEAIQRDIKSLQNEIASMTKNSQDLLASTNRDSQELVTASLSNLNERVQLLEKQAQKQGEKLRQANRKWKEYRDEVQSLQRKLADIRASIASQSKSAPLEDLVSHMQKMETQLKTCESQLKDLRLRGEELSLVAPKMVNPTEIKALQTSYIELQQKVLDKKADLLQSVSVQDQYEKLLQDYAEFLETANEKLKTETINVKDLYQLKQQLTAHKDFFSDLEVNRAMLDTLSQQCDKNTQQSHLAQHTRLNNLTYIILDKASLHGQRLERLVRQWQELSEKHDQLQAFLADIKQQMPQPVTSEDSIIAIQEKISTYQRLQRELTDEKPMVFQVVDKGKQLLHGVNCPRLEAEITDLADKWVNLNTALSLELKRTEKLGEQLQAFEAEAAVLKTWLLTAKMKLADIKHLSEKDQQSIATIRSKNDKLLEFRKEVENQEGLKNKIMFVGKQLADNKTYDTASLERSMVWLDEQWGLLEHDINKAEEYLHQAQMDLMPSRQALTELATWLNEMEEAVRQEKSKAVKNIADIEISLKKLKDFKIELQNKQLTIDFVNQSSLQTGTQESEALSPLSADKTEFAERLGTLNKRWQALSQSVNEQLRTFEMLQKKWDEYESCLSRLKDWFHEQEDKVKHYRLIGHEVSVKQTLKEIKLLQQTLKAKEEEIDHARSLGERLVELSHDSPGCQRSIQHSLDNLNKRWQQLYDQVHDLQSVLNELLSQWDAYHKELQGVNQVLSETEYCLSRYSSVGADLITLRMQVEKLKGLQKDVKKNTQKYDRCLALGTQLMQICETPAKQDIEKNLSELQKRWKSMTSDLSDRLAIYEACHSQWQQYEQEYNKARQWLDAKERLCNQLVAIKEDTSKRDECLQESKALQRDLDNFQTQLSSLYNLSDAVTKNMDNSSIVNLTSRLSALEQRVMALRQILSKQVQALQGDLSQRQRFKGLFDSVSAFVNRASRTLSDTELPKTSDTVVLQSRHEKLKLLTSEFADNMTELDNLNDLGYRLALDESSANNLRELNHKWHELYSEAKEKCKDIQGALLTQQDFTGKCDTWMTFLAETEQDLSTDIGGSLPELINQLRKCEKFESDMYSKQQILHSIISDGQKMIKDGEVENKKEFQNKLHLLAEQWQSVVKRANQRKVFVEASIKQWRDFNDLTEKLRDWLAEKEYAMTAFDVDSASLQKIKNLLEKAQNMQNEFRVREDALKQINEQAQPLLQKGNDKAREHLKVCTAQLQQHWYQLNTKLKEQCKQLEGVLKQWQECEAEIEDILSWLKDTRLTLTAELPTAYDQLQAELGKCKDIETEFATNEPRKQSLLGKEAKLGETIQPEDLNVLHQRIRLLNKQWDELRNQTVIRQQKITDNMCRWTSFNERSRELNDWMEKMEIKVVSSQEYHIEDLLRKLQKDYRDEMSEKEVTKNELVNQGHLLAKVSSEVRAADIEGKILRLEDKWTHVNSVMTFRERKLHETLLAVQQLDTSMVNLRKWLASIEHDLSTPIIYRECSLLEIQQKLQHQQEIQKDIEHHSAGVGSVLNLCEVLLHDTDACPSEKEFDALQTAMKSLDRRWRNICKLSPDMRARIEETWGLWQTLLDDMKMFSNWLDDNERKVSNICLDTPSVGPSKEEVLQCELIQKEIHEKLPQLEDINKQYRKLAREGRTDHSLVLKQKMQDANDGWDKLQQYVSTVMRRMKQSANLREDLNHSWDLMYNWLTEVQLQQNNIEHLSSMDVPTKLREIQRLQDEICGRGKKMDYLEQTARFLMDKGDRKDAIKVKQELVDIKKFYNDVINRVNAYHSELEHVVSKSDELPGDELDALERQLMAGKWDMRELEEYLESSPPESPPEKRRHLEERSASPPPHRSTSPIRVATPTLRSRSPTRSRSPSRYTSRSPARLSRSRSPMRTREALEISRQERWRRLREELAEKGREAEIETLLENLVDAIQDSKDKLCIAEDEVRAGTPSDTGTEDSFEDYYQSIKECEMSIDNMKRIERLVKTETGVYGIASADVEIQDVLRRWELLQAWIMDKDYRINQIRHDWTQFRADLDHILQWLDQMENEQATHPSTSRDITELDSIIRQHKNFLVQLESKKARVLSINLTSKNFINVRTAEGRELKEKLREMNRRWEAICERANMMQKDLKISLIQCEEFHHTVHDLLLWLENVETKVQQCEPINRGADEGALWTKLRKLKELKADMESNQPRVQSLKETADQLLINDDSMEMVNAKDKTHIISNRLRALLRLCKSYIVSLEERLNISSDNASTSLTLDLSDSRLSSYSARTSTPRTRFTQFRPGSSIRPRSPFAVTRQLLRWALPFWFRSCSNNETSTELHDVESQRKPSLSRRIIRTALPIQILLLLLLGIASLVPMTEEDYSCVLMNNFRGSLGPMLRYNNGPPPI